jgi:hypothetical protein
VPASPPASPTPELPLEPEPLLDPESALLLEPELLLDELPDPLPEPEPLPLDDDVTPASPFPLFEPELPQPADRPTKATSVVSVANLAPSQSFITSS